MGRCSEHEIYGWWVRRLVVLHSCSHFFWLSFSHLLLQPEPPHRKLCCSGLLRSDSRAAPARTPRHVRSVSRKCTVDSTPVLTQRRLSVLLRTLESLSYKMSGSWPGAAQHCFGRGEDENGMRSLLFWVWRDHKWVFRVHKGKQPFILPHRGYCPYLGYHSLK